MGNHDGYRLRDKRRDGLEPILNRINGKNRLYYLRDSGIYEYENITVEFNILNNARCKFRY